MFARHRWQHTAGVFYMGSLLAPITARPILRPLRRPAQEYLGQAGVPAFCRGSAKLAFGEDSPVLKEGRNATVQGLSGTGSLRVGI